MPVIDKNSKKIDTTKESAPKNTLKFSFVYAGKIKACKKEKFRSTFELKSDSDENLDSELLEKFEELNISS